MIIIIICLALLKLFDSVGVKSVIFLLIDSRSKMCRVVGGMSGPP